jgi:hypothetical protein
MLRKIANRLMVAASLLFVPASLGAQASSSGMPVLHTNKAYVEETLAGSSLDVTKPDKVLDFVLSSLPPRVKVYPTENYFYFNFTNAGVRWTGNLRFDVETRDEGKVHMTYYKEFTGWQQQEDSDFTVIWDEAKGVKVERLAPLFYRVTKGNRSVEFELNDLSDVKPPEDVLRAGERYLGPVFDESGIRFFLVFNPDLKQFSYILDETVAVADELIETRVSPSLTIGRRTGFAFVRDRYAPRHILVGVYAGNIASNNYLDGPFDQLPDNFIKGDELRDAILTVSPEQAGTIDRYGNSEDGSVRYLIAPYMTYETIEELESVTRCSEAEPLPHYYACFSVSVPGEGG